MPVRLPPSQLLELRGADALAFAQAQFINDIKSLPAGTWHWSGWLSAKGRLVAFFAVVRDGDERLLLWLPAGGAEDLRERLQRYVFRSKLSLRVAEDWTALGMFGPMPDTLADALSLDLPPDQGDSRHLLLVPETVAASIADDDAQARSRWRLADLRLGLPYVAAGADNSEQFVPQWLSLERLSAFSLSKGCYPGQEIVARMHYLGQSKRAAYRLAGEGPAPTTMAKVLDGEGKAIGEIAWAQTDAAGWEALAVLSADKATTVAAIEGGSAARLVT